MAAGQSVQDYIVIDDFSQGIVDSYSAVSGGDQSSAKDGAARKEDTYSCLAAPRGGLVPAWGIADSITQSLIDTAGRYHSGHPYMRVIGSHNASPVLRKGPLAPSNGTTSGTGWSTAYDGNDATPDHLFVMYEFFYDNTGSGDWRHRVSVRGYKRFLSSPATHDLVTFTSPLSMASLHADHVRYGHGAVFPYRQSYGWDSTPDPDYTLPGGPIIYMAHSLTPSRQDGVAGPTAKQYQYPDDSNNVADVTPTAHDVLEFVSITQHQGRIVAARRDFGGDPVAGANQYGYLLGDDGVVQMPEMLVAGQFNAGTTNTLVDGFFGTQLDQDDPYGFGVIHSLGANELLLVKQRGGALVARGDIDNPTVLKISGFPDVRNAANIGAQTPLGFVFGTRGGVYLYPGGDRAQSISPNLEGWFWQPTSATRLLPPQPQGKFAWFDPYIIAPGNWCMDTRNGAWMRYYPTPSLVGAGNGGRIFPFVEQSAGDHFYALNAGVSNSNSTEEYPNEIASRFSTTATMPAWSWRSQPLVRTRGRRINVREVQILAQALDGNETVTVTLYGYAHGSSYSQVLGTYAFTVPDVSRPVQLTHPFKVSGGDIEIKIVTSGPVNLYRIGIGYNEGQTAHV
jgi:hypothetical protein